MPRLPSQKQLIVLVLLISGVLLLVLVFFSKAEPAGEHAIFGALALKAPRPKAQQAPSNYQRVKDNQATQTQLRYKGQRRKENPFFSLYKQEQAPSKHTTSQKRQQAFFDLTNSDTAKQALFSAVFREPQPVQPGKALRLFLEEPITALKLKAGTLLKGIPQLEGDRIKIKITAAQVGGTMQPMALVCLDQEDCLEGLYHDGLAAHLEKATQEGLLEALWSLGLAEHEALQKGRRMAQRITGNLRPKARIMIESGRQVFVMLPPDKHSY